MTLMMNGGRQSIKSAATAARARAERPQDARDAAGEAQGASRRDRRLSVRGRLGAHGRVLDVHRGNLRIGHLRAKTIGPAK